MAGNKELHVACLVDETGSMAHLRNVTIATFNEYLDELEDMDEDIYFTLTKFNSSKIDDVVVGVPLVDVPRLSTRNYVPAYRTPLFDAIDRTISNLRERTEGKDVAVLLVIQTDGLENASTEITSPAQVKALIEGVEQEGWTVTYLGAGHDVFQAAQALGVRKGNVMHHANTVVGTQSMSATRAAVTQSWAVKGGEQSDSYVKDQEDSAPSD